MAAAVITINKSVSNVTSAMNSRSIGESQRDSVSKPRVARNELPWAGVSKFINPESGCIDYPYIVALSTINSYS